MERTLGEGNRVLGSLVLSSLFNSRRKRFGILDTSHPREKREANQHYTLEFGIHRRKEGRTF